MTAMGDDSAIENQEDVEGAMVLAMEYYQAAAFLLSVDFSRYGKMLEDLMNGFLQGDTTIFPTTVTDAHRLLENWHNDPRNHARRMDLRAGEGLTYTQHGKQQDDYQNRQPRHYGNGPGRPPINKCCNKNTQGDKPQYKCYSCGEMGHRSFEYPNKKQASSNATTGSAKDGSGNKSKSENESSWGSSGDSDAYLNHTIAHQFMQHAKGRKSQHWWVLLES